MYTQAGFGATGNVPPVASPGNQIAPGIPISTSTVFLGVAGVILLAAPGGWKLAALPVAALGLLAGAQI
jgi:hypothetical protein